MSASQIIDISQWGNVGLGTFGEQFFRCTKLNITAVDILDLTEVISFRCMFLDAFSLNADLSQWKTNEIIDMRYMFHNASLFNCNLNNFETKDVIY